jgi:hypothetical protein
MPAGDDAAATAQNTSYEPIAGPGKTGVHPTLLPAKESLDRQEEEVSGAKKSNRPELLSMDEVCRALVTGKSYPTKTEERRDSQENLDRFKG